MQIGDDTSTWKKVMDPKPDLPSLTPLNAPRISGLSRRPRWMCASTTEVVAANIWQSGLAADEDESGCNSRTGRTFLSDHIISRTGARQVVIWRTRAEKELKIKYDMALKKYYDARDRWQANPAGPPPLHPSMEAMAAAKKINDTCDDAVVDGCNPSASRAASTPPASASSCSRQIPSPRGRMPPLGDEGGRSIHRNDNENTADINIPIRQLATGPVSYRPNGASTRRSCSSHTSRPPKSTSTLDITMPTQSGTGASSSSGLATVPIVATSLRELRALQSAQLVSNLTKSKTEAHHGDLLDSQVKT